MKYFRYPTLKLYNSIYLTPNNITDMHNADSVRTVISLYILNIAMIFRRHATLLIENVPNPKRFLFFFIGYFHALQPGPLRPYSYNLQKIMRNVAIPLF